MTTLDDILRAVIAEPESDQVRLVAADWLEEHGQPERAEFVRVQVERTALETRTGLWSDESGPGQRIRALLRRERCLIDGRAWEWAGKAFIGVAARGVHWSDFLGFRCGFVSVVSLPCVAWLDHGPRLVRAAPLRRVVLTDMEPLSVSGGRYWVWLEWWIAEPMRTPQHLNHDLFQRLPYSEYNHLTRSTRGLYPTRQAALDALSTAALMWARQQTP